MKVVVPYGAGGVTDTMARLTADRLTKALGQSFVIENKVGAGGAIGIDYAMSLPRDGYTILFVGSTLFTVLPLAQKVNYEPLKDLIPVSITGTNGMVMVVPKDLPFKTLKEFVEYARQESRQNHLFERRAGHQQPPGDGLFRRQGKARHGSCAVQGRPARADGSDVEVGRHAVRQLVRPDRTGQGRRGPRDRGLDSEAHAATAGRSGCRGNLSGLRLHRLERLRRAGGRAGGDQEAPRRSAAADHARAADRDLYLGQAGDLSSTEIQAFATTQANALTTRQLSGLTTTALGNLSATQIGALATTQVQSLTTTQVNSLTTVALNALDISRVTNQQVAGLTTTAVDQLTDTQVVAFSTSQIIALSASQIGALSSTGVQALTTTQANALRPQQLNGLTTTALGLFSSTQVGAFSTTQVQGLTATQLGSLSADALGLIDINKITTTQVAGLTTTAVTNLSDTQIAGLLASQIASLTTAQIGVFTSTEIQNLTATQIGALTATQFSGLSTTALQLLPAIRSMR